MSVCLALWGRADVRWKLSSESGNGDAALWAEFVDDLASGKPYYETAVADYRARGYPTFSVVNFRQPMLYQSMAWLGVPFTFALRAAAVLLLTIRVWQQFGRWPWVELGRGARAGRRHGGGLSKVHERVNIPEYDVSSSKRTRARPA